MTKEKSYKLYIYFVRRTFEFWQFSKTKYPHFSTSPSKRTNSRLSKSLYQSESSVILHSCSSLRTGFLHHYPAWNRRNKNYLANVYTWKKLKTVYPLMWEVSQDDPHAPCVEPNVHVPRVDAKSARIVAHSPIVQHKHRFLSPLLCSHSHVINIFPQKKKKKKNAQENTLKTEKNPWKQSWVDVRAKKFKIEREPALIL